MSNVAAQTAHEKAPDDSSKPKTLLSILREFVGVADIASVGFSLPARLLAPTPNLEYWNYLDRPETFARIGKSDDNLGRMLEVLRFWFTKDLKYIKSKPCKPYNSTLGEFFRCNWEIEDSEPAISCSAAGSINNTATVNNGSAKPVKIAYLTEQTSHRPPVSAFYVDCPERGVVARGFDQISATFTGTSIRIAPGQHNLGIFVTLKKRDDEEYQLTHPAVYVGGLLRGSLTITVTDTCYVTCSKTRIKAILQYLEDGWLSKSQNRVEGTIFQYDPNNDNKTRIKDVPDSDILAKVNGSWHSQTNYILTGATESQLLMDVGPLFPVTKIVPPEEDQLPNESRRCWSQVTTAILDKQFSLATRLKQEIEERQQNEATDWKEDSEKWKPRFFTGAVTPLGKPDLTEDGKQVLKGLHEGNFKLEENKVMGA